MYLEVGPSRSRSFNEIEFLDITGCSAFQQPYRLSTGNSSMVARVTALPGENPKLPPLPETPRWIWALFPPQNRDSWPASVSIRCGWPYSLIKAIFTEG